MPTNDDPGLDECCCLALEWEQYAPLEVVLRMNVVGFWGGDIVMMEQR
jgi:hypothetical protein